MLIVDRISFAYESEPILKDLSLSLPAGEHMAIMGESGCGKSTLLKLLYGLMDLDAGDISWKGAPILGPAFNLVPGPPFMKYLAQDFDLMPFLSVSENIAQYLSVFYPDALNERTNELLALIGLEALAHKKVHLLSGGQQQRVALARVLAQKPEILLLDEPFGHIDHFLKSGLRRNIFNYLKAEGISCITATHDKEDVLPFADALVILKEKEIQAQGPPMVLCDQPQNAYVASLFAEANVVPLSLMPPYRKTEEACIIYAHEFLVSDISGIPVQTVKCYSMGHYYLIEGQASNGQTLFFNSPEPYKTGTSLFLKVGLDTLKKRTAAS